jgi:hypothetical protein
MLKDWYEVKKYLKDRIDSEQGSQFAVIEKAGLSRDSYYKLFAPEREKSPMRKSTVMGLAKALRIEVVYEYGIPQFTRKVTTKSSIFAVNARDGLEYAIRLGGSIETIAEKSKIRLEVLQSVLEPTNYDTEVSVHLFSKIAKAIDRVLIVYDNGFIDFEEYGYGGPEPPEGEPVMAPRWWHDEELDQLDDVTDIGLIELIDQDNRKKYEISDSEAIELSQLSRSRQSDGTLTQWVSILFALRALDKRQ